MTARIRVFIDFPKHNMRDPAVQINEYVIILEKKT